MKGVTKTNLLFTITFVTHLQGWALTYLKLKLS